MKKNLVENISCWITSLYSTSVECPFNRLFRPHHSQHEAQIDLVEVPCNFHHTLIGESNQIKGLDMKIIYEHKGRIMSDESEQNSKAHKVTVNWFAY